MVRHRATIGSCSSPFTCVAPFVLRRASSNEDREFTARNETMPLNTLRASSSQQLASNVVDTALAALGAAAGLYLLSFLEAAIDQPMYASSLASSAVLIFSGYRPPPPRNVFLGTLVFTDLWARTPD